MNTMKLDQWVVGLRFHCFYYVLRFEELKEHPNVE